MKKALLLSSILVCAVCISGCDQVEKTINQFLPKQQSKQKMQQTVSIQQKSVAQQQEEVQGTKLAKVNNKVITLEEFQQNIKALETLSKQINNQDLKIDKFEDKKAILDRMIDNELLYQEAISRGIQNKDDVKKALDAYLKQIVIEKLVTDAIENVTVDSKDIEQTYETYKTQFFTEPEQRRIREIVLPTEEKAKEVMIKVMQGENFATIAKEQSVSKSASKEGDMGLIARDFGGDPYKDYVAVAFSIPLGQVSSIVKGPEGFAILKVEEIKEAKVKPINEVWDLIKTQLTEGKKTQRAMELVNKLKTNATIEISEDLLK